MQLRVADVLAGALGQEPVDHALVVFRRPKAGAHQEPQLDECIEAGELVHAPQLRDARRQARRRCSLPPSPTGSRAKSFLRGGDELLPWGAEGSGRPFPESTTGTRRRRSGEGLSLPVQEEGPCARDIRHEHVREPALDRRAQRLDLVVPRRHHHDIADILHLGTGETHDALREWS